MRDGFIFEWNPRKAEINRRKHGVTFEEASTIFGDPNELMTADPDHSEEEVRSISIGRANDGRLLLAVYTQFENVIRLISARETDMYETATYQAGR